MIPGRDNSGCRQIVSSWYLEHHDVSSGDSCTELLRIGCDSRDNRRGDKSADHQDQTSRKTSVGYKMNVLATGPLLTFITYRNHAGKAYIKILSSGVSTGRRVKILVPRQERDHEAINRVLLR